MKNICNADDQQMVSGFHSFYKALAFHIETTKILREKESKEMNRQLPEEMQTTCDHTEKYIQPILLGENCQFDTGCNKPIPF